MTSKAQEFRVRVEEVLKQRGFQSLSDRWQEAIKTSPEIEDDAFWIRDSDDLINIIWLTPQDIRDITYYPDRDLSSFNLLAINHIVGIAVREGPQATTAMGSTILGNYMISANAVSSSASLYWVASSDLQKTELQRFLFLLLQRMSKG